MGFAQGLMLIILMVALFGGIYVAMVMAPLVNKLMSLIWQDPSERYRARAIARIKELCVDGNVPDEAALLMAAKEMDISEEMFKEALDGLTPSTLRAIAKGNYLSSVLLDAYKVSRNIRGLK